MQDMLVDIKNGKQGCHDLCGLLFLIIPVLIQLPNPLLNHHIDKDVEELSGQRTALGDTTAGLKGRAVVPSFSTYHEGITPVPTNEPDYPRSRSIAFQQLDAPLPIHCIECLPALGQVVRTG
jgi:hypothetical protein